MWHAPLELENLPGIRMWTPTENTFSSHLISGFLFAWVGEIIPTAARPRVVIALEFKYLPALMGSPHSLIGYLFGRC